MGCYLWRTPDMRSDMIFIAIDDHDEAWSEMLVPFMTSLRHTTYDGGVGVVSYGLSAEKLEVLKAQGIVVVPPARKCTVHCDRYLSVANYVVEHDIPRAALYDADAWFQPGAFDLFDQIADSVRMYGAPDAWFCDYVSQTIIGPNAQYFIDLGVHAVRERLGGVGVQAGMLAGTREAWLHFGRFVDDCIGRISVDFKLIHGTDTAFVHIYAGLGNLVLVDKVYSFVSKWGIQEFADLNNRLSDRNITLMSDGRLIQVMQMTGDIRYEPCWRYHNLYGGVMLDEGRRYLLGQDKDRRINAALDYNRADFAWENVGLNLKKAEGDGGVLTSPDLFQTVFGPGNGRACWALGTTRLTFEASRPVSFDLLTTYPFGAPTPEKIALGWDGQTVAMAYPASTCFSLQAGGTFSLETTSLFRDASRMAWGLRCRQD